MDPEKPGDFGVGDFFYRLVRRLAIRVTLDVALDPRIRTR